MATRPTTPPEGGVGIRPAAAGPGEARRPARAARPCGSLTPLPASPIAANRRPHRASQGHQHRSHSTQHRLDAYGAGGNNHAAGKKGKPPPPRPTTPRNPTPGAPAPQKPRNPGASDIQVPTSPAHAESSGRLTGNCSRTARNRRKPGPPRSMGSRKGLRAPGQSFEPVDNPGLGSDMREGPPLGYGGPSYCTRLLARDSGLDDSGLRDSGPGGSDRSGGSEP